MGHTPENKSALEEFQRAVGDVKPVKHTPRSDSRPPRPKPLPRQTELDERAVMQELLQHPAEFPDLETGEELSFLRDGLQKRFLTRLKRGHYSTRDVIDLHSMNEEAASKALKAFIDRAGQQQLGCVKVIHGKGLRSRKTPVLKAMTARLLSRHPLVLAFASCRPADGGTGAVSVLVRPCK